MSRDDDKRKKKTRDWQGGRSSIPFYVRGPANGNTTYGEGIALFLLNFPLVFLFSVRNGAVCRPLWLFSIVARQVGSEDEDGRHSVVPSGIFWNFALHIRVKDRPSSPAVPCHPPPSSAVLRCFPFPVVFRRPLPSPTVPYQNMSQIVGLVVLPNDGCLGNSRTRTDGILSSLLVIFSSCPTGAPDGCEHCFSCAILCQPLLNHPNRL